MKPQERLNHLLEVITIPSNRGRLKHEWVAENISLEAADGVYAAISAVSLPTAQRYNVGTGIDTTAALWKQQAEGVAQVNEGLAPHLLTLRDFELIYLPRWQNEGYGSEPTLTDIEREFSSESTLQAYRNSHSAHIVPVLDGDSPTITNLAAAFRAAADELESQ